MGREVLPTNDGAYALASEASSYVTDSPSGGRRLVNALRVLPASHIPVLSGVAMTARRML